MTRVQLVFSDTGPISYLVLIGHIDILPVVFEKIIMPLAVLDELTDPDTPLSVRRGLPTLRSGWEAREMPALSFDDDDLLGMLDDGERAAIMLAAALHADLLLMDDREGVICGSAQRAGLSQEPLASSIWPHNAARSISPMPLADSDALPSAAPKKSWRLLAQLSAR